MEFKACTKCKNDVPLNGYYKNKNNKDGLDYSCKSCRKSSFSKYHSDNLESRKEYQQKWRDSNKEKIKESFIKYRYKVTIEEVNSIFENQGMCCAICGTDTPTKKGWCIDHCHNTGLVRGVLCSKCNTAIGLLDENIDTMTSAIEYIIKHNNISISIGDIMQEMREEYIAEIKSLKDELAVLKGAK